MVRRPDGRSRRDASAGAAASRAAADIGQVGAAGQAVAAGRAATAADAVRPALAAIQGRRTAGVGAQRPAARRGRPAVVRQCLARPAQRVRLARGPVSAGDASPRGARAASAAAALASSGVVPRCEGEASAAPDALGAAQAWPRARPAALVRRLEPAAQVPRRTLTSPARGAPRQGRGRLRRPAVPPAPAETHRPRRPAARTIRRLGQRLSRPASPPRARTRRPRRLLDAVRASPS